MSFLPTPRRDTSLADTRFRGVRPHGVRLAGGASLTALCLGAALLSPAAALAQTPSQTRAPAAPPPAARTAPAAAAATSQTPAQTPAAPATTPPTTTEAAPAPAGETPAPGTEDAPEVEAITVTGRADGVRTNIDSVSYSLANDLQAQTGTLADALRGVPAVDVDPQGNVSLRGDSNVTILVDGRPSGILSGPGRAQALQQLPADRYSRIEVMTNPSAAYSPEGSGGVINLITKPTAPAASAQTTGSVRANVGDSGRWNAGYSGSWQKNRLTLSGDLNLRSDPVSVESLRVRDRLDPATGAVVSTTRVEQDSETDQTGAFGRLTAEYRLTDKTQLTGELRAVMFGGEGEGPSVFTTRTPAGVLTSAYRRDGDFDFDVANYGVTARVLHKFNNAGHEWSNELRYDRNSNDNESLAVNRYTVPVAPDLYERTEFSTETNTLGITSAYVRPLSDGGNLRLGYELTDQRPDQDTRLERGASAAALAAVPGFTNRFEASQTVHALYATYERPLTQDLSVQAGLRLEQADLEVDNVTGAASASQSYFRAYPTAHVQYTLSSTQTLRASYSRRIQRPQLTQLDPFVSYNDPLNLRSGNPNLQPQETDSFEFMWQLRKGQTYYQTTLYLRDTDKAFTDVARDVGGGVLLTRPENLGGRRDLGLELTASGRLTSTLRYNASGNVFRQEIDAGGVAGGSDREATIVSGRASLSWQPTAKDFFQVSGFWQGESLLAQGSREAGGMLNLGYRRKLTEKLSLNVTGRDVLNTFSNEIRYDTPLFRERFEQDVKLRSVLIGLTYSFGAGPRRQPEQFDFSTGQGPGGR